MKKRLLKYGIIFVILLVVVCFTYNTQVKQPIEVEGVKISITYFNDDDAKEYDTYYQSICNGDDGTQIVRLSKQLPDKTVVPEDYATIWFYFKIRNKSVLEQINFAGYFTTRSEDSRILYNLENIVPEGLKGFQTGYVTTNTADMYIHGLTEEEIVEYIKNQELELYYVNKLNNKSEHVKLKDMKNVEVEFKERDR